MPDTVSFSDVLTEYIPFIRGMAAHFPAHHRDDLVQEGLLGLFRACRSFDEDHGAPFDAYAKVCIRNRMVAAYRDLGRGDTDETLDEAETLLSADLSEAGLTSLFFDELRLSLSKMEKRVLDAYLDDRSVGEICGMTGLTAKQVDNALCRIKQKIRETYQ